MVFAISLTRIRDGSRRMTRSRFRTRAGAERAVQQIVIRKRQGFLRGFSNPRVVKLR